jgi:mRNA interferase HigB
MGSLVEGGETCSRDRTATSSRLGRTCSHSGRWYGADVWVLEERTLKAFWTRFPQAMGPLVAWLKEVERARWRTTADIRARFGSADFVGDKVVFNIGGNKYRLVVRFRYADPTATPPLNGIALILFIGTHADYDKIDVTAL